MDSSSGHERYHRTVVVDVGRWKADIDEVLAPLITEIWKVGIKTMMSCQEFKPGIAWIEFDSVDGLLRFLNIITRYEQGIDTLYNRIYYQDTASKWEYELSVMDVYDGKEESMVNGLACFRATVGVYFPTSDIPVLLHRLEESNKA